MWELESAQDPVRSAVAVSHLAISVSGGGRGGLQGAWGVPRHIQTHIH